jgi:CubicO group peptidase (beta-lactamase class C family)
MVYYEKNIRSRVMKKIVITTTILFIILFSFQSCKKISESNDDGYEPIVRNDGWLISTASEQGMDPGTLDNVYQEAKRISNLYSLLVVKNGYLIAEKYFNGSTIDTATPTASVTKSYISALTGIALRENILTGVDQKMMEFFPEFDWQELDPRKSLITLQQILQMRSGYPWEEVDGYLDPLFSTSRWIPFIKDFPLTSDPGTRFGYSNFTAHMMGIILARAAGTSLMTFGRTYLFDPLGVNVIYWPMDGYGYYYGSGDIAFIPRDMAKFGLLYLNGGMYNGNQLIPYDWVIDSFISYSTTTYSGDILSSIRQLEYGYLWWCGTSGTHRYNFAWGHGGQLIFVLNDLNMVIVTSAEYLGAQFGQEAWRKESAVMELVGRFISCL